MQSLRSIQMRTAKIKPDKSKFQTTLAGSKSTILCKFCGEKKVFDNNGIYKDVVEKIIIPFKKNHLHEKE